MFDSKRSLCLQVRCIGFSTQPPVLPYNSVIIPSFTVKMYRKSKNISFNLRQLVIFHREKGKSYRQIAAILDLKKSTVADIVNRYKNEDRIESLPQSGRRKIINEREKRKIIRKVKENPRLSASTLAAEFREESGKNVSTQTVRRLLKEDGYNGRVAIKKPYISEINRKKRLTFAKI